MIYKVIADVVVILHFLWIVFLMVGVIWGVRYRVVRIAHWLGLLFSVILQVFQWYCPLTLLEIWLRAKHDPSLTYSGSYIVHYVESIVYLEVPRWSIFIGTLVIIGINGWFYWRKWKRSR